MINYDSNMCCKKEPTSPIAVIAVGHVVMLIKQSPTIIVSRGPPPLSWITSQWRLQDFLLHSKIRIFLQKQHTIPTIEIYT